jgi:hypothetical protein
MTREEIRMTRTARFALVMVGLWAWWGPLGLLAQQAAETPAPAPTQAVTPPPESAPTPAPAEAGTPAVPPPAAAQPAAPSAATIEETGLSPALLKLGQELAASLPQRDVWTVAVADFHDLDGKVTDLGRYAAQRLSTWFSRHPGFRSVDRLRLMQALEELKVDMGTLASPVIARRVGNQIGFNALVMGTLTGLGTAIEIDARMSDLDAGVVMPAVVVRMPKDEVAAALAGPAPLPSAEQAAAAAATGAPKEPPGVLTLDERGPKPLTQNEEYRVTIESARKDGQNVTLVLAFEANGKTPYPLLFRKNAYLVDDHGDRWVQIGADSAQFWVFCCETGIELIPGTKRRTRMDFRTQETGEGETFTLVGKEVSPKKERTLVVSGIKLRAPK